MTVKLISCLFTAMLVGFYVGGIQEGRVAAEPPVAVSVRVKNCLWSMNKIHKFDSSLIQVCLASLFCVFP